MLKGILGALAGSVASNFLLFNSLIPKEHNNSVGEVPSQ